MRLLDEAKRLLREYGIRPRRSLGQSFCIDEELLERMINFANLCEQDTVLEVGSGFGFLTCLLSEAAGQVIAVEVDYKLLKALKSQFRSKGNISIIQGDILELELPRFNKVVANPPYAISFSLIMLLFRKGFERAVLTLQREFAEKLTAEAGTKNYGPLTVLADYKSHVSILEKVPQESFYPQPQVESVVILIEGCEPKFNVIDEELFIKVVGYLFTLRNRKVRLPLESLLMREMRIDKAEAGLMIRILPFMETKVCYMKPEDFGLLSNKIYTLLQSKRAVFKGNRYYVFPEVYQPSDDTFIIAEHLNVKEGDRVLDVGTGCGLLALIAAKKAGYVVSLDINPHALKCVKFNAKLNHVDDKIDMVLSDLLTGLKEDTQFDLIICNPPYLPVDEKIRFGEWIELAWNGGPSGREVIDRFLKSVDVHVTKGGKVLMVQSSLSKPEDSIKILREKGFKVEVKTEKELFFEKLILIEAEKIMQH